MALSVEVAEIAARFQWLTEQQSRELDAAKTAKVEEELADALIYLVRLADQLQIDLLEAANRKMANNEARYPAERVRGSARKYSISRNASSTGGKEMFCMQKSPVRAKTARTR